MSLAKQLLSRIQNEGKPIPGGTLEIAAFEMGYKPSTASRRLRELAERGEIEANLQRGYVVYSTKPKQQSLI